MARTPKWTKADRIAANSEGWDIFNLGGPDCRVERIDYPDDWPALPNGRKPPYLRGGDAQAWRIVKRGAKAGYALHVKALALVPQEERDRINAVRI